MYSALLCANELILIIGCKCSSVSGADDGNICHEIIRRYRANGGEKGMPPPMAYSVLSGD